MSFTDLSHRLVPRQLLYGGLGVIVPLLVIVSAVAELVRNLVIERVRAGLRRARLEGRTLGRKPIDIDRVGCCATVPAA